MLKTTALHEKHRELGAKLVDFAGWEMPIQYRSQLDEHHVVRQSAGIFDVSHMCVVDLVGARVREFLQQVLANDVGKLRTPGKALYTCMLNDSGGVVDDLIVYFLATDRFRLVVNAATTDKDLAWLRQHADPYRVAVVPRRELGMLAIQGPQARAVAASHLPEALSQRVLALTPFSAVWEGDCFVSRTGYSGEDGVELILPHGRLVELWDSLVANDVRPCGLGARDTLRLEAGLSLYGQDMDDAVTPLESGLGWTVAWSPEDRCFIGRAALEALRWRPPRRAIGLVLTGRGVLRNHMRIRDATGDAVGEITSGGFAPTLKTSIALGRVSSDAQTPFEVEIRGRWETVREVKPPFVRNGTVLV